VRVIDQLDHVPVPVVAVWLVVYVDRRAGTHESRQRVSWRSVCLQLVAKHVGHLTQKLAGGYSLAGADLRMPQPGLFSEDAPVAGTDLSG
jgi:hypothetical protein